MLKKLDVANVNLIIVEIVFDSKNFDRFFVWFLINIDEKEGAFPRATWLSVTVHLPIWPLVIPIFLKSEGRTDIPKL